MADCSAQEGTTAEHCWHPMTAPYGVVTADSEVVPAIGECCCQCGAAHVKILTARPDDAHGHGEYLVFVEPNPVPTPLPRGLIVPQPRILH